MKANRRLQASRMKPRTPEPERYTVREGQVSDIGVFPFGLPILPVAQKHLKPKRVFVLGVYASAVHARWVGPDGKPVIAAIGVASEPEIFWRGDGVESILSRVSVPREVGRLELASEKLNGPSGVALDERFLAPLGLSRGDAWLCNLVPHSCMNPRQKVAIQDRYMPYVRKSMLPNHTWKPVPQQLATKSRRSEIVAEVLKSKATVIITLGDQPLRWFTRHFGSKGRLATYGTGTADYGRLHPIEIRGREISLLPLVHPRQAAGLGTHSSVWLDVHELWAKKTARNLLH